MTGDRQWRGVVNGVLYMVQFEPSLDDDAVVAARAEQLLAAPPFDQPVAELLSALRAALADGRPLTGGVPQPHDEATVRAFLTRVADRIDAARPWVPPPYRKLPAHTRPDVLDAPAVARIGFDWKQTADRLGRSIDRVGDHAVLVLELATGHVVAVVDDWDITARTGARDGWSTLVTTSPERSAEVVDAFRAATGFGPADLTPLPPYDHAG